MFFVEPFASFSTEYCIRLEEIVDPAAQYAFDSSMDNFWFDKDVGVLISRTVILPCLTSAKSRGLINYSNCLGGTPPIAECGGLIAESIHYSLTSGGSGTAASKPNIDCGANEVTGKGGNMLAAMRSYFSEVR